MARIENSWCKRQKNIENYWKRQNFLLISTPLLTVCKSESMSFTFGDFQVAKCSKYTVFLKALETLTQWTASASLHQAQNQPQMFPTQLCQKCVTGVQVQALQISGHFICPCFHGPDPPPDTSAPNGLHGHEDFHWRKKIVFVDLQNLIASTLL